MLLPELYALPHPNFFKLHVPVFGLARSLFVYLLPLSGARSLPHIHFSVSVNNFPETPFYFQAAFSAAPYRPHCLRFSSRFLALCKFIYLIPKKYISCELNLQTISPVITFRHIFC